MRLVPLLALLVGCSVAHAGTLRTLRSFPDAERAEVERAVAKWNERVRPEKRLAFDDDGRWIVTRRSPCTGTNGYADNTERIVYVTPGPEHAGPGASTYATALHELGHVLGLGHTTRGVMDPEHVTIEFSEEDMAECHRAGACP